MPTLFTMTVDTEEEWDWTTGWPTGNLSVTNVRQLPQFQDLCERFGVATTYFVNQAVLDDPTARQTMLALAGRERVEVGMHIHPWNTPPLVPNGPVRARETYLHNLPDDVILAKLHSVYDRFVRLGWRPTSFRGGRYSSGRIVQQFLRDQGFRADASVVPYTTWREDGAPDYRQRGLSPVRLPPRFSGDASLWEVPLTLGFTHRPFPFWGRCCELVERTWLRKLRLIGLADRIGLLRKVWLNFEEPMGRQMLPFLRMLRRMELPCICFTVHSSSLVAGSNPYARTPADVERIFARMREVFATLAGWPAFRPATVTEVARKLEEECHACTWN
jgi:hypothetical protein